ncbi:related to chloroperoxidase [Lecanosticta acicola]|uniref:Related to chloroperoxidase n=1 Tax=Lecanosticta acicola TaxID=111012 RepID=A0AAI8Z5C7_9PEZI|nr:related to chloroperoxidase [Lecanosticta acicola]
MRRFTVNLLWATAASALPTLEERDFSTWSPPGAGDVRSPCPGLNSLANHGFIPHDGKNMTLDTIIQGLADGMNIDAPFASFLFAGGSLAAPDNRQLQSFDLNDLDQHNFPIEHDASLSRQDAFFGNDYSFNQTIFNQVLSFYDGMANTSIPVASKAKYARVQDSQQRDPTFTYGPREFILSYGETALYLSIMGDPTTGVAPVDYVKIFFEQERLPYNEGWRKPTQQTTLLTVGDMINQLYASSPEPLPEGLEILTVGAYQDALAGINPVTNALGNLTCGVAGTC